MYVYAWFPNVSCWSTDTISQPSLPTRGNGLLEVGPIPTIPADRLAFSSSMARDFVLSSVLLLFSLRPLFCFSSLSFCRFFSAFSRRSFFSISNLACSACRLSYLHGMRWSARGNNYNFSGSHTLCENSSLRLKHTLQVHYNLTSYTFLALSLTLSSQPVLSGPPHPLQGHHLTHHQT